MSTAILKLSETGELQRIHDKWLMRSACSLQGAKLEVVRLPLKSFSGLFLVCGIACSLALSVYFMLMIRQYRRYYAEESESKSESLGRTSRSAHLQAFLSFANEKEEEAKSRSKRRQFERASNRSNGDDESTHTSKKVRTEMSSNRSASFSVGTN